MPSSTLSQDLLNNLSGINLKWVNADLAAIREITLIYFKNAANAEIKSLIVSPAASKINLPSGFDSGAAYQFQLQVTDAIGVTVYSNFVSLTTPFFLVSPSITSIDGNDAALTVHLAATGNVLTNAGGDKVEFLIKRQSDNVLFWIVKA